VKKIENIDIGLKKNLSVSNMDCTGCLYFLLQ